MGLLADLSHARKASLDRHGFYGERTDRKLDRRNMGAEGWESGQLSLFQPPVSLWLQEWFTIYEHNRRPSCTVSDLIMGNEYSFRVFSENICGRSDDPGVSKNTAVIGKTGAERPRLDPVALEADAR